MKETDLKSSENKIIHLTKHMLSMHSETIELIKYIDKGRITLAVAMISGRKYMLEEMFREIRRSDIKFKKVMDNCIKEINEEVKKNTDILNGNSTHEYIA